MDFTEIDLIWKALADPARRRILDLLREQPKTTGMLCEAFTQVTRFAVMKQINILAEAGLVISKRQGRQRWNYLNAVPLQQIYERWIKPYEAQWASSLIQLATQVESDLNTVKEDVMQHSYNSDVSKIRIEQTIKIAASRQKVFQALTQEVSSWWGLPYLQNDAAKDILLEPRLSGRLYEMWSDTEGAEWARVTSIKHNEHLELTGRLAMHGAVQCVVYFNLEDKDDHTIVNFSHHAIGDIDTKTAEMFSAGWDDLLNTRLRLFIEKNECYGLGYAPPPNAPFMNQ
ncbi:SRPBCC domain-containing protein [Kaarinaea lacus]